MNFLKLIFTFLFVFNISSYAIALTLTEVNESAMDPTDELWFASAGIKRAGFAGNSNYSYIMNQDASTGIQLIISKIDGSQILEEFYEDTRPLDIQVYPNDDYIFIYHEEPGQLNSKYIDIYQLSSGQKVKQIFRLDFRSYFFHSSESKIYYTSSQKNYVYDLTSETETSSDYDGNTLRAYRTSKGLFFVERLVGMSTGWVLDENLNKLYEINNPSQIYLRPLQFNMTIKNDRYLMVYNRVESKLISLYDLNEDIELLNEATGDISISKSLDNTKALAFYHENTQLVSFLDINDDSLTKKDIGYQYIFKSVIDPTTNNLRFWTFPQNKIVDVNFNSLNTDSVDFQCRNYTFSADASHVGCIERDKFKWWELN